ncbi:MAG: D-alanyl-D-alanine carboxypeptidase [Clostridia bacterium]|nr:D-alanyl-D-alanine carboxypeptidase [Clostridia bacterium]
MKRIVCVFAVLCLSFCLSLPFSAGAVSATAAVVINGDTGDILYSRNADVRLPMASTTKIMTAILLIENCDDLDDELITTREMVKVEGSSMGLLPGDRVSYRALLYGMMLSSGNDAANTTAIAIGGSIGGFVDMMNAKAAELGLNNTHFATPSGLDAEGHYTTAAELALLTAYALKNPVFAEAAAAKSATLCFGNPPYRRTVKNHNKLLSMYNDVIGVKTGYTKKSGRCLVSAARQDGKYVIAVTLNDGNDWADHRVLLDTGLAAIDVYEFTPPAATVSVPLVNGGAAEVLSNIGAAQFCIPKGQSVTAVTCLPRFLYAPVLKNEIIGSVDYYCSDRLVYRSNIIVQADAQYKAAGVLLEIFEIFKYMFRS